MAFVGEISNGIITTVFNFILLSLVGNIAVAAYGVIANSALVGVADVKQVSHKDCSLWQVKLTVRVRKKT